MQKSGNTVRLYVNEYDVEMLEISGEKRSTFISLKKALAILETNNDPNLLSKIEKYGRELYNVKYVNGKSFNIGQAKIETVLDNDQTILLALHANIDTTKEA